MNKELNFYKEPYLKNMREKILKLINPPHNIRKGEIVKKAEISHATFIYFMQNHKSTRLEVVKKLEKVINSYGVV